MHLIFFFNRVNPLFLGVFEFMNYFVNYFNLNSRYHHYHYLNHLSLTKLNHFAVLVPSYLLIFKLALKSLLIKLNLITSIYSSGLSPICSVYYFSSSLIFFICSSLYLLIASSFF